VTFDFPLAAAPAAAVQTTQDDWPIIYFPRLANSQLLGPQSSQRAADPPPAASVAAILAAAVQTTLDVWPIARLANNWAGSQSVKVLNFLLG